MFPFEALNNRNLKTTYQSYQSHYKQPKCTPQEPLPNIAQKDAKQKQKMKIYANLKVYAQERKIKPGGGVLMRQPKHNTLSTPKAFRCGGEKGYNGHSK